MQVDPYVKASVRDSRTSRTRTLMNNNKPVWEETFNLIVDDPNTQSVTFVVMDDDLGAFDDVRTPLSSFLLLCDGVSTSFAAALRLYMIASTREGSHR